MRSHFWSHAEGGALFARASWIRQPSGVLLLAGALAALECKVEEIIERHSHAIVIGSVRRVDYHRLKGRLPTE